MKQCRSFRRGFLSPSVILASAAFGAALTGCGESNVTTDSIPSQASHYFGTANLAGGQVGKGPGGVWNVTLDNTTSYFSYNDIDGGGSSLGAVPDVGTFSASPNGILDLTLSQKATGSGGYAVNLSGEGFLMRTGSSQTDVYGVSPSALIGGTISDACPTFTSPQTYNFIAEGTTVLQDTIVHVAYGSVQITPGAASTWSYSNFTMYDLSGNSLSPAPIPDATCPASPEGSVLVSPLPNATEIGGITIANGPTQVTVGVSPSGLLAIDQGQNDGYSALVNFGPTGPIGLLGVARPSTALNVSDLVSKTYAGLESDPLSPLGTVAVVFGTIPVSGTTINGGGFPNDDVTQPPLTNLTLNLGAQSSQTPGLFTSVTLTAPDTYGACLGTPSGGTLNGNPVCIFHGAAVAGQVGGKYVIFTNINDPTAQVNSHATPLAVINLALYQQ